MLAQIPRLKFHWGFSKAFFYSFAKEPGKGRSSVSRTHCCIYNSPVFFSSMKIATENLGSQASLFKNNSHLFF